jgi:histidine triad (HIT) family protein
MDDCPFCAIAAGTAPAHVAYDGETAVAFLDANPAARGHTLVAPRDHYETLTDAPPETATATFEAVHRVVGAIEAAVAPDGVTVVQSNGAAAGQDVDHLHVHVIPRYDDDTIAFAPPRDRLDPATGDAVAADIREET